MFCGLWQHDRLPHDRRLRILLTNGRFPVSLDLARQLYMAGHSVYVVDPMKYHVCAFSITVQNSMQIPAPHDNAKGYIRGVMHAVKKWKIDQIIPVHEEIFFLAECEERVVLDRLFAPPFDLLIRLHNKWEFTNLMKRLRMDVPKAYLCQSYGDVENLPVDKYEHGMALKPAFGRASTGVHHLKSGEPLPKPEVLNIGRRQHYIAQEWIKGNRYCSYSIIRDGRLEATGLYPVIETIDGSSSVYFEQCYHAKIYAYIAQWVRRCSEAHGPFSSQIAFDFVEDIHNDRLLTIECNPRSTSGLHLWSRTPYLAYILTDALPNVRQEIKHMLPPTSRHAHRPAHVQVAAGMVMWEHKDATLRVWAAHMNRLMGTRDVVWSWTDLMPTVAQPFLLTEYYRLCRHAHLQLPELFQWQLLWEPEGAHLDEVRKAMEEADAKDERSPRLQLDHVRQDSPTLGKTKQQPDAPHLEDGI